MHQIKNRYSASAEQIERLSLKRGDVVITKDSETPDDIGIPALVSEELDNVVCGYHLALLRPLRNELDGSFLNRFLQSNFVKSVFHTEATGITRYALGKYSIKNFPLASPPLTEQKAIAEFLDAETLKIAELIGKQERLIALLQEKRQALISHAITKGLNPNAPRKDSGVDWLGEIPEHWEVLRNKVIFKETDERSLAGDEELLTVSHITGVTPRSEKEVNMFLAESLEGYKKFKRGDLIIIEVTQLG